MSIFGRIRKQIAQRLLGKNYVILGSDEYTHIRTEFQEKIVELEKQLEAVLIDEAEYYFLKHFSSTLVMLEKRLHESDNADEILKATYQTACEFLKRIGRDFWNWTGKRRYGGLSVGIPSKTMT